MRPDLKHRYTEHTLATRAEIAKTGSLRQRAQYDLVNRPPYIMGLLTAADVAKNFGYSKTTIIEFGVADGKGLLNLCELAPLVTEETGIAFNIIGVDNASGLPTPGDYRDHPEVWSEGDFTMGDRSQLEADLPDFASLVIADVADALPGVISSIPFDAPLGFAIHDMDVYSSTAATLPLYAMDIRKLLPVSIAFFDDTIGSPGRMGSLFRNEWSGQLLAIKEFNESSDIRKIDIIRSFKHRRPLHHELWLDKVYGVHALDHPARNADTRESAMSLTEYIASPLHLWAY